jgi:GDP-6-deoxy-D-talose 4-dehydrogenase
MKILITGINGFVGRILRRSLETRGHQIYGIDIESSDPDVSAVDITDQTAVIRCLERISPDAVCHLAAISRVDYSDPSRLYSINVNGTINLLTACVRLEPHPKFLLASSCQVYGIVGDEKQPISESCEVRPVNHYGASKAAAEYIAQGFHKVHGLPMAIVRPFNHIGRGQDPHFVIAKIINAIKEKKAEIELGNLAVIREFLDVRDVVVVYTKLMEQFPDGMILNIASGRGYRVYDIIQLLQEITRTPLKIKNAESLLRQNEMVKLVGDDSALKQLYNWHTTFTIRETLEWILSE